MIFHTSKGKRGNQEISNFFASLTPDDQAVLRENSVLHGRLNHAAEVMCKMLCYWPAKKSVGHVVSALQNLQRRTGRGRGWSRQTTPCRSDKTSMAKSRLEKGSQGTELRQLQRHMEGKMAFG
ncbi:hypothetical protein AK812_SmicGene2735 [Symbiodinium microadriaticum]|uniref:Uncharacterized protein n=1 Tax=Symbiodinium microadriaticum TaxID=2951 RepID=A0A1Q9F0W8_SYMMI|nr:hypothetical protein AK812_SmicGene2735 [Symbiodinium microadriaticum]